VEWVAGKPHFVVLAAIAMALACALPAAPAQAQIDFTPCRESNRLACATLTVPLSPTGAVPGTVKLAIRRQRAPVGEAHTAVIALAGGPGQAAIPFTETFDEVLGPILATRDLIVFDQRGTGLSGALKCKAFQSQNGSETAAQSVRRCAQQIGPGSGYYTTPETVADIEAIRVAGGYEKLVLYGTSYGTKVALQYAQQHPSHVEALVLDSVVPPEGPEALHLNTFAAVPRVLREICAFHGCNHITASPVQDLSKVVARMGHRGLRSTAFDIHGKRYTIHIGSADLLDILVAGDLDPVLRAEFPAAIDAAARGQTALLGRLLRHALVSEGEESEQGNDPAFDGPLYYATMCEESPFPWSRSASAKQRIAEATAKIDSLPQSVLAPFTRADVLPFSDIPACAEWPFSRPAPPLGSGPLPAVPTLIISGEEDLRTPTSGARQVASRIPGSQLLVVPNTGHSVLTTEPELCALDALHALFAAHAIKRCKAKAPPAYLKPTPLAPLRLAQLAPTHGYGGRVGRTLTAIALTLKDLVRELAIAIGQAGGLEAIGRSAIASGGLHGGWVALAPRRLLMHDYSYLPGVSLSGWTGVEQVEFRVGGHSGADGVLRLNGHGDLVGYLEGVAIQISTKHLLGAGSKGSSLAEIASAGGSSLPSGLARRLAGSPSGRTLVSLLALDSGLGGSGGGSSQAALAYELTHRLGRATGLR
jgi:pimeloyl-ACP methyl ester carboxylesterase